MNLKKFSNNIQLFGILLELEENQRIKNKEAEEIVISENGWIMKEIFLNLSIGLFFHKHFLIAF